MQTPSQISKIIIVYKKFTPGFNFRSDSVLQSLLIMGICSAKKPAGLDDKGVFGGMDSNYEMKFQVKMKNFRAKDLKLVAGVEPDGHESRREVRGEHLHFADRLQ